MVEAVGRFARQTRDRGVFAKVTVMVDESRPRNIKVGGPEEGQQEQGGVDGAPASWKKGAVVGAEYALRTAGREGCRVVITKILGTDADTNSTVVAAATSEAVWKAIGYSPTRAEADCLSKAVRDSAGPNHGAIPDLG
jgi:hypothetical protein